MMFHSGLDVGGSGTTALGSEWRLGDAWCHLTPSTPTPLSPPPPVGAKPLPAGRFPVVVVDLEPCISPGVRFDSPILLTF